MSKAENIVFFDAIFIMLLGAFGFGGNQASFAALQTIPFPQLAPAPPKVTDIISATAYIGWAFVNLPVLIVYFIGIILIFANVILTIAFDPVVNGIPYFGIMFFALQVGVIFEVFRIVRGSSSGV